jgi:NADH-quinone oxidoreductase subunit E
VTLSATTRSRIESLRERYPHPRSAILPCLWAVQDEHGWLPPETMAEVAGMLALAPSEVQAVATFYSMYFTRPRGEHQVVVCVNAPCALRGAEDVVAYLERKLSCPSGGTTADGKFTWQSTIECLGACGYAPMMQVDHHFHENLTPDKIDSILERVAGDAGDAPAATPPPRPQRRSRTRGQVATDGAADGRDGDAAQ